MPKNFYITTSIAYANAYPHIGFALEIIQADVLARYHRVLGDDVLFLTGTDEHGLKIAKAAERAGKSPKQFVDGVSDKFRKLDKALDISNDDFIRTTDKKRHQPVVERVWSELEKKGDIYKKRYRGLYCLGCEAFIQEKDLVNGRCPIHQTEPEVVEEENYFFRLSKYALRIRKILEEDKIEIVPRPKKKEVLNFIKQGIDDVSCSRSREKLSWGIPVPGDKSQTIYVWFEALLNYISALGYPDSERFKRYWPADVHCIGKDIFRFHALLWPAMLLSLGLKLPKKILVHGFINVDGQKMSKSLGNVIDPFGLVETYGTDAVRYFLLREMPATEDGDFTYQKFKERYNSDLANGLGNLLARVTTMADNIISKHGLQILNQPRNPSLRKQVKKTEKNYRRALENFRFNEALGFIWDLIAFSDRYIEREKPWEKRENSPQVLLDLLAVLNNIAELLGPFLPETSRKIKEEIGKSNKKRKPLFPRLN